MIVTQSSSVLGRTDLNHHSVVYRYHWPESPTEIQFTPDSAIETQLGIDYRGAEGYMVCVAPVIRRCDEAKTACETWERCANATNYCDARRRVAYDACSFWDYGAKCAAGAMVPVDLKSKFFLGLVLPHPKGTNEQKGTKTRCRSRRSGYTHCSSTKVVMTCLEAWNQAFTCPERHWYTRDVPLVCGA